jgi:hypothetical protein
MYISQLDIGHAPFFHPTYQEVDMPLTYENPTAVARPVADWRAIWAGVFTFIAIWAVFGFLGLAIFASAANPSSAQPLMGMSAGLGIWAIVLTIIAMYVAGRETGRLAAVANRHDGLIHGMIMFGLSVGAVVVITALAGGLFGTSTAAATHSANALAITANVSWILFVSLFLGWLAAMGGASTGAAKRGRPEQQPVQEIKRVA